MLMDREDNSFMKLLISKVMSMINMIISKETEDHTFIKMLLIIVMYMIKVIIYKERDLSL